MDVLLNLNINIASGQYGISNKMLKETAQSIKKPLSIIFNRSLQERIFPSYWKTASVIPFFKKGEKEQASNDRPISLLSCIEKVMEKMVYKNIYNYLLSNKFLFKNQYGFRSNHSTVHQLIEIYNQICQSLDAKQFTCLIFCHVSKAFDRVWQRGLLHKLKQYGITDKLLSWTQNYLSDRQQKVLVSSSSSQNLPVKAGVPQGSILGPLFFLLYINDIADNLLSVTRLFADDTSLAQTTSSLLDLEGILNHDL